MSPALNEPWELVSLWLPDYSLSSLKAFPCTALHLNQRFHSIHKHHCGALFLNSFFLPTILPHKFQLLCLHSALTAEALLEFSSRKMVLGRKPGPGPGLSSQHVFFSPGWQSCAASRPVFENTCFEPIFSSVLILWQENTHDLSYHPVMAGNRGLLNIALNHFGLKHRLHWLYIGC